MGNIFPRRWISLGTTINPLSLSCDTYVYYCAREGQLRAVGHRDGAIATDDTVQFRLQLLLHIGVAGEVGDSPRERHVGRLLKCTQVLFRQVFSSPT